MESCPVASAHCRYNADHRMSLHANCGRSVAMRQQNLNYNSCLFPKGMISRQDKTKYPKYFRQRHVSDLLCG